MTRASRREALAAAAVLALTGARPAAALPRATGTLWNLLAVERQMVAGYGAALATGIATPAVARLLTRLRREELGHVAEIEGTLRSIGADIPAAKPFVVRDIQRARSQTSLIELAIEIEEAAVAANIGAAEDLTEAFALDPVGHALSDHGRHLAELRLALGRPPLGPAFETGSP